MNKIFFKPKLFYAHVIVALIGITLISCKKENDPGGDGSGYYVRFKSNGTLVEYKEYAEGNFNKSAGGKYASTMAGLKENFVATKNNMSLSVATVAENTVNITYTNYTVSSAGMQKAALVSLAYYDDKGEFFMTWTEEFASALPAGVETNAHILFTEQTEQYLKGLFSGKMYNEDFSKKLDITDGEFYVKRVR